MRLGKKLSGILIVILTTVITFSSIVLSSATIAHAKASSIVILNKEGSYNEYDYMALKTSAEAYALGDTVNGALYQNFSQNQVSIYAYFDDSRNVYVPKSVIDQQAVSCALNNTQFNFNAYIENTNTPSITVTATKVQNTPPDNFSPSLKITTLSDSHYYDTSLGVTGKAFENYVASDRKLLAESSAIFDAAINNIKNSDSNVVLLSGDLTKDGELIDHQDVEKKLEELKAAGKKVYVIDGNHDILNPNAVKYNGDTTTPVDHITPEQFKQIYADFGYNDAIAKDPNSLSYVVEPINGVRIIAIDSCEYNTNISDNYPKTAGTLSPERLNWVMEQVKDAKKNNKLIIGMMHHGVVPHFSMEPQLFPEYLLDNYQDVSQQLADAGLNLVFTGHFHEQDAAKMTTNAGNTLYDIETGSLVTYPCPYREIQIKDNKATITTDKIDKIDYDTGSTNFPNYAKNYLETGMKTLVPQMLAEVFVKQGVPASQAMQLAESTAKTQIAPQLDPSITVGSLISDSMIKNYMGDETMDPTTNQIVQGLLASKDSTYQMLGHAIKSLLVDDTPDNNFQIDLSTLK